MIQLDCAGTEDGIAALKQKYRKLIGRHPSLKDTTTWLDNEDEILEKAPFLERDQIKVCEPGYSYISETNLKSKTVTRDGKEFSDKKAAGLQRRRRSMPSELS